MLENILKIWFKFFFTKQSYKIRYQADYTPDYFNINFLSDDFPFTSIEIR